MLPTRSPARDPTSHPGSRTAAAGGGSGGSAAAGGQGASGGGNIGRGGAGGGGSTRPDTATTPAVQTACGVEVQGVIR